MPFLLSPCPGGPAGSVTLLHTYRKHQSQGVSAHLISLSGNKTHHNECLDTRSMLFLLAACRTSLPALCLPSICPLLLSLPGQVKTITQPKTPPVQRRAVTAQLGTCRGCSCVENPQIWPEEAKPSHSASGRGLPVPPTDWVTLVSLLLQLLLPPCTNSGSPTPILKLPPTGIKAESPVPATWFILRRTRYWTFLFYFYFMFCIMPSGIGKAL